MKDYISAQGAVSESELLSLAEKYMREDSNVYAVHTDKFYCGASLDIDEKHLLELRIFTQSSEIRFARMNIGTDFGWRYIDDNAFEKALAKEKDVFLRELANRVYDEAHYLDADQTRSSGNNYTTTGGGAYTLPVENAEKVKIRNYLEYDENGIVFISDLRIVGFIQKGRENNVYGMV